MFQITFAHVIVSLIVIPIIMYELYNDYAETVVRAEDEERIDRMKTLNDSWWIVLYSDFALIAGSIMSSYLLLGEIPYIGQIGFISAVVLFYSLFPIGFGIGATTC